MDSYKHCSKSCHELNKSKDNLTLGISFDLYGKFYLYNSTNNKYYQINVEHNDHPCADEVEYNIIGKKENFNNFTLLDDESLKSNIRKKIKEIMDDDCELDEEDMIYHTYYDHYEEDFYCTDIKKTKEKNFDYHDKNVEKILPYFSYDQNINRLKNYEYDIEDYTSSSESDDDISDIDHEYGDNNLKFNFSVKERCRYVPVHSVYECCLMSLYDTFLYNSSGEIFFKATAPDSSSIYRFGFYLNDNNSGLTGNKSEMTFRKIGNKKRTYIIKINEDGISFQLK